MEMDATRELCEACESGDKTRVLQLLQQGADPNSKEARNNKIGETPLHYACQHGWLDVVQLLVDEHKCDPRQERANILQAHGGWTRTGSQMTPLHLACQYGMVEVVELLVDKYQCNPNVTDFFKLTPLHYACQHGHVEVAKLLIEKYKCDVGCDSKQLTPLHLACEYGRLEIATLLIETYKCNPKVKDSHKWTPLHLACEYGEVEIAKLLIEKYKCSPNVKTSDGLTPLHLACKNGRVEVARLLTEKYQCNPNVTTKKKMTPLHLACEYGKVDVAKLLIEVCQCSPNVVGLGNLTPLHLACENGQVDVIKLLVELYKCNPNVISSEKLTPLHLACKRGRIEVVKLLIENYECNPNIVDSKGKTPLHIACEFGKVEVTQLLIEKYHCNPNVEAKYDYGKTPLHYACQKIHSKVVLLLVKNECKLNNKDKNGRTPLHYAYDSVDTLKTLITHGAKFVVDNDGNTPLHNACNWSVYPDSVKYLLSVRECDPNAQNKHGQTSLHLLACSKITAYSVRNLHVKELTKHGADPNVADSNGDTPLHVACNTEQLELVQSLLTLKECNPNAKNNAGFTPFQVTPLWHSQLIKELVEHGANPNVTYNNGNTPLHIACGSIVVLDSVKCLLTAKDCDPNAKNEDGLTPLQVTSSNHSHIIQELIKHGANPNVTDRDANTPLHNACRTGNLDSVKHLLTAKDCDPNAKNKDRLTPLQVTSPKDVYIIKKLVTHGANPNVANSRGNTPLHNACRTGDLDLVKCLLTIKECDPNAKNKAGLTPFEVISANPGLKKFPEYTKFEIMIEFFSRGFYPNAADSDGNTPLHIACQTGNLDSVKRLLLTEKKCDPNVKNKDGLTPLQVTSPWYTRIIQELIEHGAHSNVADSDGNTPLHEACQESSFDAVKHLLTAADCNPNAKNKDGVTPLKVASTKNTTPAIIIELIRHGAHASDVYKAHTKVLNGALNPPVKVFVVGNPRVGKSTLTAALQKESSFFGRVFTPKQKITGQDERTAGIVPHEYESKEYGYVTFYDFAGQREFYGSHAAVLKNVIRSFPPIFLLVVDLCESEDEIVTSILYWLTFLENQCASVTSTPHVIIVGSHADVLKERGENPISKIKSLKANTAIQQTKFVLVGFITMNCQYPESRGMSELRQCLKTSCNALRTKETITFNSHCFYVYLVDKFKESFAVTVEQIQTEITTEFKESPDTNTVTSFIPDSLHPLCKICDELNDRGHILFLKDSHNIEQSWVVIDKKYLLEQVSGSVFAPEHFKQHTVITQCTCSTGVVPLSSIAKSFPEHNPQLLTKYLSCLEFCHEISDSQVVHRITAEHQTCVVNGPSSTLSDSEECYFLFPALVSLNVPAHVWDNKSEYAHHFGWILHCSTERQEHFFTSRFLQVLILRMAATHPFPLAEGDKIQSNPAIQRNCSIWKSGIFWGNDRGVETLVEVLPDNKAVIVLMRCGEAAIVDFVRLRSQVIQQVLRAAEEFCSSITKSESFIDPSQCKQYPLDALPKLKLFSMLNTSKAVLDARPSAAVVNPTGTILLDKLIHCEPYAGLGEDVLWEIFESGDQDMQIISQSFLAQFAKAKSKDFNLFIKMFSPEIEAHTDAAASQDVLPVLRIWRAECAGTYKSLRETLDKFSVFAGRNPLTLAGREQWPKPKPPQAAQDKLGEEKLSSIAEAIPVKSDKPTLKLLQVLKLSEKQVKVIESVAAEWEKLAIALGFGPPVIDYLRRDFSHDSKGAATEALTKWLNGESELDLPTTYQEAWGFLYVVNTHGEQD